MRTIRSILAVAATLVAVLAVAAGVADAGQAYTTDIDVQCDTDTGEFVLTLSIDNLFAEDGDIEAAYTVFAGSEETASGEIPMTPNPVPDGETSTGVLTVPNTTTFVDITVAVDYGDGAVTSNVGAEIGEECEAVPTTPTTAGTTSTTAAAPAAQVQPRFTG